MPSMRNQDVGPYEESRRKFGLCRKLQQGAVQEGEDTDIVREERASGSNEEGGRHHPERVGESDGDKDGGLFRDTEGALWPETEQGEDKADRDPVHLLRHPHGERGPACPGGEPPKLSRPPDVPHVERYLYRSIGSGRI